MAHKQKQKMRLSRDDIAAQLRALADSIAAGTVTAGDRQYPVPDNATYEFEADDDEVEIEVSWKLETRRQPESQLS
jgi:amphi-Trp domain-containing protein